MDFNRDREKLTLIGLTLAARLEKLFPRRGFDLDEQGAASGYKVKFAISRAKKMLMALKEE